MSLRTALLRVKDRIRESVLSPRGLDMTPHQVTVRTRTWAGGRKGANPPVTIPATPEYTDSDLVLPQRYKLRQLSMREVAGSGGLYTAGDVIVEHITPSDGAGVGYTPAQLNPTPTPPKNGVEILYVVAGPLRGEYGLVEAKLSGALSYHLVLRLRRTTPTTT